MTSRSLRRLVPACVISSAAVVALAAPGSAGAFTLEKCHGGNIKGQGSSAQKILQKEIWNKQFNTSSNSLACASGTPEPKVEYESTGSGAGLKSWGVEPEAGKPVNFGPKNAFLGGELPPSQKQQEEILKHGSGKVLTIPVAQPAIAILIHLPAGCTSVEGGPAPGRIALKDSTLEKIFQGTDTEWSKILNKAKLKGSPTCEKEGKKSHITRVVREDGSGTTGSFMKYLGVIYKKEVATKKFWKDLAEPTTNTTWPNEATDEVKRGNGGGGVVTKVEETAGSVGYANVADARAKHQFTPPTFGPKTTQFWAEVENGKGSYADPSTNGDVEATANANCEETNYVNGKKKFPPPSPEVPWNEVTISKTQKNYEPCYLTYDIALTNYAAFTKELVSGETPTEQEARTVFDYINYELSTGPGGAQEAAEGQDYLGDPVAELEENNVLLVGRKGASKIGF
jgi:ABC-type phosphate transport system substrate-binding protein